MPFLMSFALVPEIVTFAWIDNASVQFPLNIYATKESRRLTLAERKPPPGPPTRVTTRGGTPAGTAAALKET
jgi:hypothetical protein